MKAILEFDLPDDADAFAAAVSANKLHSALWDISQKIREVVKYSEDEA